MGGHCGAEAGVIQAEAGVYQKEPTLARVGNVMPLGSWQVARLSRAVPCGKQGCAKHRCPACEKWLLQGSCDQTFHFF